MDTRQIKHIISPLLKKSENDLARIAAAFDPELIHRFRVSYKKLRAFLKLLPQQNTRTAIKIPVPLKRINSLLGRLRNIQLQQQRIMSAPQAEKYQGYLDVLQLQVQQLQTSLQKQVTKKLAARSKKQLLVAVHSTTGRARFSKMAKKNYAAVTALLLAAPHSDANIHRIRKLLKDVLYNCTTCVAFKKHLPPVAAWKGKDVQQLDALLNRLGNFQDCCIAIALLDKRRLGKLSKKEQGALNVLKKEWQAAKRILKKELLTVLKNNFTAGNNIFK